MSSITPSPIPDASETLRGAMTPAEFSKLLDLPDAETLSAALTAATDAAAAAQLTANSAASAASNAQTTASNAASAASTAQSTASSAATAASNAQAKADTSVQLTGAQSIDGAKRGTAHALSSSSAHIALDFALGNNFSHTTSENTTLDNPANQAAGQHGAIVITQGATARTMAFGTAWKFPGGTVPTLTATVGAVDVLTYYVAASGQIIASLLKDVR